MWGPRARGEQRARTAGARRPVPPRRERPARRVQARAAYAHWTAGATAAAVGKAASKTSAATARAAGAMARRRPANAATLQRVPASARAPACQSIKQRGSSRVRRALSADARAICGCPQLPRRILFARLARGCIGAGAACQKLQSKRVQRTQPDRGAHAGGPGTHQEGASREIERDVATNRTKLHATCDLRSRRHKGGTCLGRRALPRSF